MNFTNHKTQKAAFCLLAALMLTACSASSAVKTSSAGNSGTEAMEESSRAESARESYSYAEYPLERNGISLHLDCVKLENTDPERNILMMHGSTYSSHEFDIDYEDYSLVRRLTREGYAVWRLELGYYDGDSSPNAWRKDALVSEDKVLIDLEKITVPTLVICGDKDPYLNYDAVNTSLERLPEGSELKVIPGGSHILLYEKNCYKEFQDYVAEFLTK